MVKQKIDEVAAKKRGDTFFVEAGAINVVGPVISSELKTSIVQLQPGQPEIAEALKTLVGYVAQQNNAEAGEALTNLSEAIRNKQKPSQIKAYWNELVENLTRYRKADGSCEYYCKNIHTLKADYNLRLEASGIVRLSTMPGNEPACSQSGYRGKVPRRFGLKGVLLVFAACADEAALKGALASNSVPLLLRPRQARP